MNGCEMDTKNFSEEVIIVDDDVKVCEVLVELAKSGGFKVSFYHDAVDALKNISKHTPFLIISDYQMPGMNGLKFCQELRKISPQIPFIIVSAYADKEMAIAGLSQGVTELIEKPIDPQYFISVIAKHAKNRIDAIEAERAEVEQITQLFIEESGDLLAGADQLVLRLEERPVDSVVIDSLFRKIHSVKGGAGAVPGGQHLSSLAHEFESVLSKIKKNEYEPGQEAINVFLTATDLCIKLLQHLSPPDSLPEDLREGVRKTTESLKEIKEKGKTSSAAPTTSTKAKEEPSQEDEGIWVTNEKLDAFMALSGELIVLKNHFQMINRDLDTTDDMKTIKKKQSEFAYGLNKITDHLQEHIMSVRKVSLDKAFGKLGRIVRQTSIDVGKRVKLKSEGLEMGVDKNIAKSLSSSMVHMVRNSIDHGIETPDKRKQNGKVEEGTITIKAQETQGTIFIIVSDDGGGIAKDKVIAKAVQNGLLTAEKAAQLSDSEIFDLIFLPGFSTAEKVTGVSGRGVGMDVVKSSVINHSGKIKIESKMGQGTKFQIEIPVPKAVMVEQTVLGRWKDSVFAVPLTAVARISSCDKLVVNNIDNIRMCQYDGQTVVLRSFEELNADNDSIAMEEVKKKTVLFLRHKHSVFGLLVDSIEDQLEAVVRPFDSVVKSIPGFKGTTVLGNEQIAYVVSPEEMVNLTKRPDLKELAAG